MLKHFTLLFTLITVASASEINVDKECFMRTKTKLGGEGLTNVTHATELEKAMTSDMKISKIKGCENAENYITSL